MTTPLHNQRGVAMLMAITTMLVLGILAAELVYETQVYNGIIFRQVDQLRARMLARSALRLAIFQLKAADKAKAVGTSMGVTMDDSMTNRIWQTPMVLPPPSPGGLALSDSQALEGFKKSLALQGSLTVSITAESDRLNLNQLVWLPKDSSKKTANNNNNGGFGGEIWPPPGTQDPNQNAEDDKNKEALKAVRQSYSEIVDKILEQKRQSDDNFRNRYATVQADVLIGNLLAWMDPNTTMDGENRQKEDYYSRLENPYSLKNAPLASESEVYMVRGFDDTLTNLLMDNFSIQASAGINPNKAPKSLLRALIPELNEDSLNKIEERKKEKPFSDEKDFWDFLGTLGNFEDSKKNLEKKGIKFLQPETSYRVVVTGQSGQATKTWIALIGEAPPEVPGGQNLLQADPAASANGKTDEKKEKEKEPETDPNNPDTKKKTTGKSDSKSLHIIYLKAD